MKTKNSNKAQILAIVIIIISIITVISTAVIFRILTKTKTSVNVETLTQSELLADSAIKHVQNLFSSNIGWENYCSCTQTEAGMCRKYICEFDQSEVDQILGTSGNNCSGYVVRETKYSIETNEFNKDDTIEIKFNESNPLKNLTLKFTVPLVGGSPSSQAGNSFDTTWRTPVYVYSIYDWNGEYYTQDDKLIYSTYTESVGDSDYDNRKLRRNDNANSRIYEFTYNAQNTTDVVRLKLTFNEEIPDLKINISSTEALENTYFASAVCGSTQTEMVFKDKLYSGIPSFFDYVLYNNYGELTTN